MAPGSNHGLMADRGNLEQPQLQTSTAPLASLSERSLAAIRLVLALISGCLMGVDHMPQWPLPPLLGLVSLMLLAVARAPGTGVKAGPSSSRTSLVSLLYSLVPAPVQRAVAVAGIAMRTCQFVLEPVAAAIAFAAVLNHVR